MSQKQSRFLILISLFVLGIEQTLANAASPAENGSTQNVDIAQYVALARSRHAGEPEKAFQIFKTLPEIMKRDPVVQLAQFELMFESNKYAEATRIGEEIMKKDPRNGRVLCSLAVMRLRAGNSEAAIKFLKIAIDVDPYYARSYYELARISRQPKDVIMLCARGLLVVETDKALAKDMTELMSKADISFRGRLDN